MPQDPFAQYAVKQDDAPFRQWYADMSKRYDLNPDPDAPEQAYDYRSAFKAGAKPDASGHWPSDFKKAGHPNEIVGGFNTRTGERVPGTPRLPEPELVKMGWDPATAKRLAAMPEPSDSGDPFAKFAAPPPAAPRTWGDTAKDVAVGFGKGAARTVAGLVNSAAQSRMIPGINPGTVPPQVVDKFTPEYANSAQQVGGAIETAAELAPGAIGLARGAVGLARAGAQKFGPEIMRSATSDVGVLTQIRQAAAKKILGRVLEMPKANPNAGGRVVKGVGKNVDNVIADALEELRAPAPAQSVELPPPSQLPAGYAPRTSAPAPAPSATSAPSPNAGGRLTPAAPAKTLDQQLSESLAELQRPARPTLVTTPPAAELPPGYTPRATVPRSQPAAGEPRKRAYFLKPAEEAATAAPTREAHAIGLEDLPESWRSRVGDVAPPQGVAGADLAKAFAAELSSRGVSAKDAILLVSKNPSLPPGVRLQLISALKKAGGIK